jgi:hypothetical protein
MYGVRWLRYSNAEVLQSTGWCQHTGQFACKRPHSSLPFRVLLPFLSMTRFSTNSSNRRYKRQSTQSRGIAHSFSALVLPRVGPEGSEPPFGTRLAVHSPAGSLCGGWGAFEAAQQSQRDRIVPAMQGACCQKIRVVMYAIKCFLSIFQAPACSCIPSCSVARYLLSLRANLRPVQILRLL